MTRFLATRAASLVLVVLALALAVFVLQQVSPVDPVRVRMGATASVETVEAERARLGYDDPVAVQYVRYVGDLATGDLGESLRTRRPVAQDLAGFVPASLELGATALLVAGVLGLAVGAATALRSRGSGVLRLGVIGGASLPAFLLGMLGLVLFYRQLGWLPSSGRTSYRGFAGPTGFMVLDGLLTGNPAVALDALRHLVLPATCLALAPAAAIARVLRGGLVTAMRSDWARTARAKGLTERAVLVRHALRNGAGPALSMAGLQVGLLLASLVLVEQIFAWPGVGLYLAQSIPTSDFPAIAGVTLLLGVTYVLVNAIVDALQVWADPRLRL